MANGDATRGPQRRLQALESFPFYEPGAPRALACSIDGRVVCVGFKDGRVLAFPSRPPRGFQPASVSSPEDARGIRSLCDVTQAGDTRQRWLVGRVGGRVDWLHVDDVARPVPAFGGVAIADKPSSPDD